jgi:hypothetical protein
VKDLKIKDKQLSAARQDLETALQIAADKSIEEITKMLTTATTREECLNPRSCISQSHLVPDNWRSGCRADVEK